VLRYLARLEERSDGRLAVSVGPVEVDAGDLAARLVGVEAYVAFTTARHAERPLVVQGQGVGGAQTAGTVLAEIFRAAVGGGGAR
jgi:homoserine dehydrogenase